MTVANITQFATVENGLSLLLAAAAALLIVFIVFLLLTGLIGPALLLSLSRIVPVRVHILSVLLLIRLG